MSETATSERGQAGSGASDVTVLKWAWRHFALGIEEFTSVEDAVDAARWASDAGEESLMGIEVWDGSGYRYIPADDAFALAEERRPPGPDQPKFVLVAEVSAPAGDTCGRMEWFTTTADAGAFIDKWRPILGDRLSLRSIRP